MKRYLGRGIEPLESRTLFSIVGHVPPPEPQIPPIGVIVASNPGSGFTLHETAGVPFTAKVAFYPTPVLDPPFGYSASINWGDGTTMPGTFLYGSQGNAFGIIVSGKHTYAKSGTFSIKTEIIYGPLPGSGIEVPSRIVSTISSSAIVGARKGNSYNGVTIDEIAGKKFTATLGTFTAIAPAANLRATINWGDGATSAGVVQSTGVIGIDVIKFAVSGTHAYALPGTYPIHIVVTQSFLLGGSAPQVIATIDSTAVVTLPLAGTITGTYSIPPLANPDAGQTYIFDGSGVAGALGKVTASATVRVPGFITSGRAAGTMTLTNSQGSVTLALKGPVEAGFGKFPKTLTYEITSGTGAYADDEGTGTIAVTLSASIGAAKHFTFVIT